MVVIKTDEGTALSSSVKDLRALHVVGMIHRAASKH